MDTAEFFEALQAAATTPDVESALEQFEMANRAKVTWTAFGGRNNNRGVIEVSTDPGRALVERVTNGIDAILEAEHAAHRGQPECRTPKEAATAWLNVPEVGLSEMTTRQRQRLAERVTIRMLPGDGGAGRTVEVRDHGIGLTPPDMAGTILSLNESNKLQKHYLAGTYGQGGSSTLTVSKYTLIATRIAGHPSVGFTVVKFLDLPPDQFKSGRYAYLTHHGGVLNPTLAESSFAAGTLVKIFGYDLSSYPGPVGPNSIYGLLNQILFDPVLPVWFDDRVHGYRRVIKGSRNALNGAVDEGDEDRRGPSLAHNVRMFYVTLGEFGRLGIEYWVLEQPTKKKKPTAAFVNPSKPIVLTLQGQNQAELSSVLVRRNAELPHLRERLICHVDCNYLTPAAKRALFVSNREDARRGVVYELIQQEVIRALRSDDELARLNREAHELGMRQRDESAIQQMRSEVARLLRLQGINVAEAVGGATAVHGEGTERNTHPPRGPRRTPDPITLHEPPTYIRILWDPDESITFYPQQRRYLRIETDANSNYHDPNDPAISRINLIVAGGGSVLPRGSTSLQGGRLRAIFEGAPDAIPGQAGTVRVELARPGLPMLSDERRFQIVPTPPARPATRAVTLPPFDHQPVEGLDDPHWTTLAWPDSINAVASSAEMESGTLMIYYSTVFPKYANQLAAFERRDPALARSFGERYKIWLAVHSLLFHQDQLQGAHPQRPDEDPEIEDGRERQERCRIATLAAVFAAREVQSMSIPGDSE